MRKINLQVPLNNIENILGSVTSPSIVLSELIKNSIDSNAKDIRININTIPENQIIISDDGDGFTIKDIENLGIVSESNKKISGNNFRKDGSFFTGSKGLGILSLFSISKKFIMETERNKERFKIMWVKGQSSFNYEKIDCINSNGTVITITDIENEYLTILTDENELNKLKHISIKNYTVSSLNQKNILFFINEKECKELNVTHITNLSDKFISKINFKYEETDNILYFKYNSSNNLVNNTEIKIDLNKEVNISKILMDSYNLLSKQITYKGQACKYLEFLLESFHGEIYVAEKRRDIALPLFGAGVRVFVNQFAMYGYLDKENDWLNFSVFSLLIKNTRYKPHNVFGFVHFENLNENESNLKISNERAYFIENGAFKKFHEILKNIITTLAFNIDVAEKNGYFSNSNNKTIYPNEIKNINPNLNIQPQVNSSKPLSVESITNVEKKENNSTQKINTDQIQVNKVKIGTPNSSEEQKSVIKIDKKPPFNFFNVSNIIKFPDKIEIEYDELLNQLRKLDYKNFYLIFGIAFRAMLEDISKKYLNTRGIKLCSDFGQNIRLMTDDIVIVIKDTSLIDTQNKIYIENILGGYHAFKNFFETTGADFYNNGKQGIKATKLNSFVHAPRWMEIEEAENMANNIILPLYVISKEIINRIKK